MDKKGNQTASDKTQAEVKKEYDGSRAPFVLVKNLKSTQSIDRALSRIKKRFTWIKERNLEIQRDIDDPGRAPYEKREWFAENKKLATEVPKLQMKERELRERRPAIREQEEKELESMQLEEINLNDD